MLDDLYKNNSYEELEIQEKSTCRESSKRCQKRADLQQTNAQKKCVRYDTIVGI